MLISVYSKSYLVKEAREGLTSTNPKLVVMRKCFLAGDGEQLVMNLSLFLTSS